MSTIIVQEIKDCQDCKHCKETRYYTEDSWEHAYDYWCGLVGYDNSNLRDPQRRMNENRLIAGYVEWRREMPSVPSWCPLRPDRDERLKEEIKAERSKYIAAGI